MSCYLQIFKTLMKADACDYGDGMTTVRNRFKRSAAAAEEAEAADVGTPGQTPGQAMENRTPLDATTANGHDRFEHIGNEYSAAGTVILVLISSAITWQGCTTRRTQTNMSFDHGVILTCT